MKKKIIDYKDYDGFFLCLDWKSNVFDSDELEEIIYEFLEDKDFEDEDIRTLIPVARVECKLDLDLRTLICDKAERIDYEQIDRLDFQNKDFLEAQKLLNKWKKGQGDLNLYCESNDTFVDITELIKELKKEISGE